jgi:hypothetical protein
MGVKDGEAGDIKYKEREGDMGLLLNEASEGKQEREKSKGGQQERSKEKRSDRNTTQKQHP